MRENIWGLRLALISSGLALGWLARILLGDPAVDDTPRRTIERPIQIEPAEAFELPDEKLDS